MRKFSKYLTEEQFNEGFECIKNNKSSDVLNAISSTKALIYKDKQSNMDLQTAYKTIHENLIYSEEAKNKYGEIFTPFILINEMLDILPIEVWSNKDLKWLDPCAGIGNFPIAIYDRLMEGLKEIIIDEEERRKHILENMLYMVEIQSKNVMILLSALNHKEIYNLNLFVGSYLSTEFIQYSKYNWNVEKFNIIVANPPYNPNNIWKEFIELSIHTILDTGHILMIHPDTWRTSDKFKNYYNLIIKGLNELHIKEFNAFKSSKVGISVDFYLWSKNKNKNTKVVYLNNDIDFIELNTIQKILRISINSIPYKIFNKIFNKVDNGIIFVNTGFATKKRLPSGHIKNGKYKICGGEGNGTGWTKGNFVLTDTPVEHQFEDKVVMSYTRSPRAKFFSKNDEIGVGKGNYWLTSNESLPLLLNSKILNKIFNIIIPSFNENEKDRQLIPGWLLKSINFENLIAQTEEDLYKHYNLTEEEINWINLD